MEVTISSIVTDIGTVFTGAIDWVGDVATTIAGNPLLMTFTLIPLVGLGIGMFKRLLNVN